MPGTTRITVTLPTAQVATLRGLKAFTDPPPPAPPRTRGGPRMAVRPSGVVPGGGPRGRRSGYRNELISIVSVRPGPTPIAEIGAPDISSRAFTYALAFFGSSSKVFALVMSSDQPGKVS